MSYQVLARKWRPRIFKEMAGQEHVLKALINALDNDRLHHAYLFTGTRGVGKTTIARILAKCLNCEGGITSEPCGECGSCVEINEGRFIDLIEVDAASRTKVEDTRELLENVQYAPTRGRFKVYLIDEVHMLSTHSFNALLKTLEEPPPHVKFLLATTDPQKLPVTILSRCLQFNLKNLSPERIAEHLKFVLGEEHVPCEEGGVWALSRAADGSMRDALSLTDQAIAHGDGKVTELDVNAMLGTIDHRWVAELCKAIIENNASQAMAVVAQMAEHGPDYAAVLADILGFWHRIAIAQTVPDALDNHHGDFAQVMDLARQVSREDVQLCYQIALLGKRDLPLAPDARMGFEMALLRQLAFKPGDSSMQAPVTAGAVSVKKSQAVASAEAVVAQKTPDSSTIASAAVADLAQIQAEGAARSTEIASSTTEDQKTPLAEQQRAAEKLLEPVSAQAAKDIPPWEEQPETDLTSQLESKPAPKSVSALHKSADTTQEPGNTLAQPVEQLDAVPQSVTSAAASLTESDDNGALNWLALHQQLQVTGMVRNTSANLVLVAQSESVLRLQLDRNYSSLYEPSHQQRIARALAEYLGRDYCVEIEVADVSAETPRTYAERLRGEKQATALRAMQNDPLVADLTRLMGGQLLAETVKPSDL